MDELRSWLVSLESLSVDRLWLTRGKKNTLFQSAGRNFPLPSAMAVSQSGFLFNDRIQ